MNELASPVPLIASVVGALASSAVLLFTEQRGRPSARLAGWHVFSFTGVLAAGVLAGYGGLSIRVGIGPIGIGGGTIAALWASILWLQSIVLDVLIQARHPRLRVPATNRLLATIQRARVLFPFVDIIAEVTDASNMSVKVTNHNWQVAQCRRLVRRMKDRAATALAEDFRDRHLGSTSGLSEADRRKKANKLLADASSPDTTPMQRTMTVLAGIRGLPNGESYLTAQALVRS